VNTTFRHNDVEAMEELEIYNRAIGILDSFHEESEKIIKEIKRPQTWRELTIYNLFRQGSHITFVLLSNSERSKFLNPTYVTELILIGTLGRIVRDIYVNIIYLKTYQFSEEQMKMCWDFQTLCQKINAIKFESVKEADEARIDAETKKEELKAQIDQITFSTKSDLFRGKTEKLLNLVELAQIKEFDKGKFHNEFVYFSQFAHSTAFANSFIEENGINLALVAITYDKIVAYYVGVVYESLELLFPNHHQLSELQILYKDIVHKRWNS